MRDRFSIVAATGVSDQMRHEHKKNHYDLPFATVLLSLYKPHAHRVAHVRHEVDIAVSAAGHAEVRELVARQLVWILQVVDHSLSDQRGIYGARVELAEAHDLLIGP